MRRLHKPRRSLIIIGVVMSLLVLGWLVFWHQAASNHLNNQPAPQPTRHSTPPLTAGGAPVPAAFRDKARQLGYYCPSWDAKPGQVAPDICLPLGK